MKRDKSVKSANEKYRQYTGTQDWYKYMAGYLLTDGTHGIATETQSFWFLDIIVSYKFDKKQRMKNVYCQRWVLQRKGDTDSFEIIGHNDDNEAVIRQDIEFSDFPFDSYEVLVCNNVILLPSEN